MDEIEDLTSATQATLLSLLQDGVLVETKLSKTRRLAFPCSVIATCNSTKKLRYALLSRFATIELKEYEKEEFEKVTMDVLKNHPQFIAEQVWLTEDPNIRTCVRLASMSQTEQDVLRLMRCLKK